MLNYVTFRKDILECIKCNKNTQNIIAKYKLDQDDAVDLLIMNMEYLYCKRSNMKIMHITNALVDKVWKRIKDNNYVL